MNAAEVREGARKRFLASRYESLKESEQQEVKELKKKINDYIEKSLKDGRDEFSFEEHLSDNVLAGCIPANEIMHRKEGSYKISPKKDCFEVSSFRKLCLEYEQLGYKVDSKINVYTKNKIDFTLS